MLGNVTLQVFRVGSGRSEGDDRRSRVSSFTSWKLSRQSCSSDVRELDLLLITNLKGNNYDADADADGDEEGGSMTCSEVRPCMTSRSRSLQWKSPAPENLKRRENRASSGE